LLVVREVAKRLPSEVAQKKFLTDAVQMPVRAQTAPCQQHDKAIGQRNAATYPSGTSLSNPG
jgi:hypothetical protein